MNNANEKRLLEFTVYSNGGKSYKLEVKEGKPTRISSFTPYQCEVIYPKDDMFNIMVEIIVTKLSEYENLELLKKLYNALEDGYWKRFVKKRIDNCIEYFEKGLAILKS